MDFIKLWGLAKSGYLIRWTDDPNIISTWKWFDISLLKSSQNSGQNFKI